MLIIVGNALARKMPEYGAESHQSSARFVGWLANKETLATMKEQIDNTAKFYAEPRHFEKVDEN